MDRVLLGLSDSNNKIIDNDILCLNSCTKIFDCIINIFSKFFT